MRSLGIRPKIAEWRANRAWKVWKKNVAQGKDAIVMMQYDDGFTKPYPAEYDATLERYIIERGDGELIPVMANQDTDMCNIDGLRTIFAYHGLSRPISNFATAELSERTHDMWRSGELFISRDDLKALQYDEADDSELDPDEIDSLEQDDKGKYFEIAGAKVRSVADVEAEMSDAAQNERQPAFRFDEEGNIRDQHGDRVLKRHNIPMPETHAVDLRALAHTSAADEDAPSDMRRVEDEAVVSQNEPGSERGTQLAKVGYIMLGALVAWVSTVLTNSSSSSSGGGGGGGGGSAGGGGGGGPAPDAVPNPLPETMHVPMDQALEAVDFVTQVAVELPGTVL